MSAHPVLEPVPSASTEQLLVCLPALPEQALSLALDNIAAAFPGEEVLIASPVSVPPDHSSNIELLPYKNGREDAGWVIAAGDYAAAAALAQEHDAQAILLLNNTAAIGDPQLLRSLAEGIRGKSIDLAVPRFVLGPTDGLVNSALLYPLTRALFGTDIRLPLPVDAALSPRMAQRLGIAAQRSVAQNQPSSLLWPIAEAAIAGFSVREVNAGSALPPQPPEGDFNALFNAVASSLFADIEAKATFWQRARSMPSRATPDAPASIANSVAVSADIQSMIDSFHLAQANLQEIWSLVLPPQSRLELKRLSQLPSEAFSISPSLWARVVYDFALAFHLRTLNRNHLLGAMTPLYLAWVAGHLHAAEQDPALAQRSLDQTASAFETERSYLISRWRWPDRFNP